MPDDAQRVLAGCQGFFGASSMERLPVEEALVQQAKHFKALTHSPS